MKGGHVLLATWGDPQRWVMAEYNVEDTGPGGAAFTSTEALARALGARWTLILGLDTLFKQKPSDPAPAGYGEVVGESRAYLEKFKCGLVADVEVLPGVINSARTRVRAVGDPRDFYMIALYTMVWRILGVGGSLPRVVALDITHGINFMPNLSTAAALNAAAYLSLARALQGQDAAWLEVYNSDPIIPSRDDPCGRGADPCKPREVCKPASLTIHKVMKHRAGAPEIIAAVDRLSWNLSQGGRRVLRPGVGERDIITMATSLNNRARETLRDALLLVRTFRLGLAPQLLHLARDLTSLRERIASTIQEALSIWREGVRIVEENGWTTVERRLSLDHGFELLVHALALATALAPLEEKGATLRAARELKDAYRKIGAQVTHTVQQREIEKIEKAIKNIPRGTVSLASLLGECVPRLTSTTGIESCQKFARDLVAHGGWHTRLVKLRRKEHEVMIILSEKCACRENGGTRTVWEVIEKYYNP